MKEWTKNKVQCTLCACMLAFSCLIFHKLVSCTQVFPVVLTCTLCILVQNSFDTVIREDLHNKLISSGMYIYVYPRINLVDYYLNR